MIKLPNIKGLALLGKAAVAAHKPEILFGTSVVSTVSAVIMAARGGYKSALQVTQAELDIDDEAFAALKTQELTPKEKIQLTWINYLPAAGLTAGALGSTTGLHLVHLKEKKAIAAAALMAIDEVKQQSNEYIDGLMKEVEGVAGEKKAAEIRDNVMDPDKTGKVQVENSNHEVEELYLVRDAKTGRDMWSNANRIEEAVTTVNNFIAKHGDCDLNSFYSNAGFEIIPDGDDWGWSGDWVEVKWDTVTRDDGRPVRRFAFRTDPTKGYDRPVS